MVNYIKRKIFNFFHPQVAKVLMLHRVISERSKLKINRSLEITPEYLEKTINEYVSNGYKFISLDELVKINNQTKWWHKRKRNVCFTFDDGYFDNYEIAYPIFKKYNCPFSIYITTAFYDSKAIIWWYILEDILLKNNKLILSDGSSFDVETIEKKNKTFDILHKKLSILNVNELKSTFELLFSNYEFSFENKVKELSLTVNQIKKLALDPLCTIASHTVSHPRLSKINEKEQIFEIEESKKKLEELIKLPINHFAYPFGDYNFYSKEIAKKSGYHSSVMAWGGLFRKSNNLHEIPRINLVEN